MECTQLKNGRIGILPELLADISLITGVMGAAKVEMVNGFTLSELMEE